MDVLGHLKGGGGAECIITLLALMLQCFLEAGLLYIGQRLNDRHEF